MTFEATVTVFKSDAHHCQRHLVQLASTGLEAVSLQAHIDYHLFQSALRNLAVAALPMPIDDVFKRLVEVLFSLLSFLEPIPVAFACAFRCARAHLSFLV
jgi:hypothetical protein